MSGKFEGTGVYAASIGSTLLERGNYQPTPVDNYLSGDGKSHTFRGPGYYVPSERRWMLACEYRSLPMETRRDAIWMESEDQFVAFLRLRDKKTQPGGITMAKFQEQRVTPGLEQLRPFFRDAWSKPWNGAGWFVPSQNRWVHDHYDPAIPREAFQFYNEEDWLKFKHLAEQPYLEPQWT